MSFVLVCLLFFSQVSGQLLLKSQNTKFTNTFEFTISYGINPFDVTIPPLSNISHIVIYGLSPYYEISLSSLQSFPSSNTSHGTSVGVVFLRNWVFPSRIFVKSNHYMTMSVWLGIVAYNETQPIPGGCNQIYPRNIEPTLSIRSVEPLMEVVVFARAETWRRRGGWLESCESRDQWSSLRYHLYGIPVATLGGQRWPPWRSSFNASDNENGKAVDVTSWPLPRHFVAQQMQLLLSPSSTRKYGYHLGSYEGGTALLRANTFFLARRYANVYAFVVLVETEDGQEAMHVPQLMYSCPSAQASRPDVIHYNSSWTCNNILTEGTTESITAGVTIAVGAFVFFVLAYKRPTWASALCYYWTLCIITSALVEQYGTIRKQYSMYLGLMFGALPFLTMLHLCCCIPAITETKKPSRRLVFWPGILFVFLLLATIYFTPLNAYTFMRSSNIYIAVFVSVHLLLTLLLTMFPSVLYAVSIGTISAYWMLLGITTSFVPQSLWYLIGFDYLMSFASADFLTAIHFTPIGIYDGVIFCVYFLLALFGSILIYFKWRGQSNRLTRVSPAVTDIPIPSRPTPPAQNSPNNQLTIVCETHHYHVRREEDQRENNTTTFVPEPTAPRGSAWEMETGPGCSESRVQNGGRYGSVLDYAAPPPAYNEAYAPPPLYLQKAPPPYAPNFRL